MEQHITFKCEGENLEQIPAEIISKTGVTFPLAHQNSRDMALLSKALKEYKQDTLCRVPFCVTVEAEALGGNIKLGDEKFGPRVENHVFKSLEEMRDIPKIDFTKGRIREVLDSVSLLSQEGETVALSIEGPFTIISALIDPMIFYKEIRKNKDLVDAVMKNIEDNIIAYMQEGLKRGARILSYGDPVGSMDIVGPKIYREISGITTQRILKRIENQLDHALVHLCGKTSTACLSLELCREIPIEVPAGLTYGQAIKQLLQQDSGVRFIGHACIKRSPQKLSQPVVWGIEFI